VKVAVEMDMVESGRDLVKAGSDQSGCERSTSTRFGELIEVSLHALKDKVELARFWRNEGVVEGDNVVVRGY
jgi:hypothetical protein